MLIIGILGVAYCVAFIGQRQVVVASGPAFRRISRESGRGSSNTADDMEKGVANAKSAYKSGIVESAHKCFSYGRSITLSTFLFVCALVSSGIIVLGSSETTDLWSQSTGVRLFGAGIAVACVVFSLVTFSASTYVINVIQEHLNTVICRPEKRPSEDGRVPDNKSVNAFTVVISKLRKLRLLVVLCLFGSLLVGAAMLILPGSIEYIFPISAINGALLLSVYIAIDSGVASQRIKSQKGASSSTLQTDRSSRSGVVRKTSSAKFSANVAASTPSTPAGGSITIAPLSIYRKDSAVDFSTFTSSGTQSTATSSGIAASSEDADDERSSSDPLSLFGCLCAGDGFMTIASSTLTQSTSSSSYHSSTNRRNASGTTRSISGDVSGNADSATDMYNVSNMAAAGHSTDVESGLVPSASELNVHLPSRTSRPIVMKYPAVSSTSSDSYDSSSESD